MLQQQILSDLCIDHRLIKLVRQEIEIPYIGDGYNSANDYWYGHPPALIPLFLGQGASYIGLLNHWCVDRKRTLVEYELEWGYMLERARTADQLFMLMMFDMVMIAEEVNEKIIEFAENIGHLDPFIVDDFASKFGDNPRQIRHLISLNKDTPLTYLEELQNYTGDYPTSERILNPNAIARTSLFTEWPNIGSTVGKDPPLKRAPTSKDGTPA